MEKEKEGTAQRSGVHEEGIGGDWRCREGGKQGEGARGGRVKGADRVPRECACENFYVFILIVFIERI